MQNVNAWSTKTDEELFEAVRCGSQEAMEALVRRYHAELFGYAFRLVRDYHWAQDFVQEAFYRLIRNTDTVQKPGVIRTWLYRVVTHLAMDWGKSATTRREVPSESTDGIARRGDANRPAEPRNHAEIIPIENILEQREDRQRVAEALRRLTEQQRVVIYLRFYQDLSLNEIAEVLAIPPGTVKSRLHYGLKSLHAWLTAAAGQALPHGRTKEASEHE